MKTEPTDIDREAARLFIPAPGMRVWFLHDGIPSRILNGAGMARWERGGCDFAVETSGPLGLDALDTDDPATAGCMLAQVEDAAGARVDMTWDWDFATRRFIEYVALWEGDDCIGVARRGRTRGAALVAAMKAIKGDPTQ